MLLGEFRKPAEGYTACQAERLFILARSPLVVGNIERSSIFMTQKRNQDCQQNQGEREHLLPSEPDKADTQGCDARAVVDHR